MKDQESCQNGKCHKSNIFFRCLFAVSPEPSNGVNTQTKDGQRTEHREIEQGRKSDRGLCSSGE